MTSLLKVFIQKTKIKFFARLISLILIFGAFDACKKEEEQSIPSNNDISTQRWIITGGTSGNIVYDIDEDKNGGIWLATKSGLRKYESGKWKRYTTADGLPNDAITSIEYDDASHQIYFSAMQNGINKFDINNEVSSNILEYGTYSIEIDQNRYLWYRQSKKLYKINLTTGITEEIVDLNNSLEASSEFRFFKLDKFNLPWVEILKYHYDQASFHFEVLGIKSSANNTYDFTDINLGYSEFVQDIFFDSKDKVWVGTHDRLYLFDGTKWSVQTMNGSEFGVSSIVEDNRGNIIIASYKHGIIKYNNGSFNRINSGLTSEYANSLFKDSNGFIWIGGNSEVVKMGAL